MHEEKMPVRALKRNLPESVFNDVLNFTPFPYGKVALSALVTAKNEEIAETADCSEGLENRLKAMLKSTPDYDGALKKIVSKRYTLSRIKRILAQNLLGIRLRDVRDFAEAPLYYNVLALKKESSEEILSELSNGKFPTIARKSDYSLLKKEALSCFETDLFAVELYNALSETYTNPYETLFV